MKEVVKMNLNNQTTDNANMLLSWGLIAGLAMVLISLTLLILAVKSSKPKNQFTLFSIGIVTVIIGFIFPLTAAGNSSGVTVDNLINEAKDVYGITLTKKEAYDLTSSENQSKYLYNDKLIILTLVDKDKTNAKLYKGETELERLNNSNW
jgi:Na+/melibiose symporter-like transporter